MTGVVIFLLSLCGGPDGTPSSYNEGNNLAHEVSHSLGLYPTAQGDSRDGRGNILIISEDNDAAEIRTLIISEDQWSDDHSEGRDKAGATTGHLVFGTLHTADDGGASGKSTPTFYPYPQVPLGWRKVTLEWDDGWWHLDFVSK